MMKAGFVSNVTSVNVGLSFSNPLTRSFSVKKQVGCCGVEMPWKIYEAVRIVDGMECSLFVFEKRIADKLHKPRRKEIICDLLRKEVNQLQNFNHSKILKVIQTMEENNDTIVFAAERVIGSLANLLGNDIRLSQTATQEIKKHKLTDLEIKHGIYQLTDCLRYLHTSQQLIHNNVNPSTILITESGHWKLFGTGFMISTSNCTEDQINELQWSAKKPKMVQSDLDYIAPEIQLGGPITSAIDMFSIGLVICTAYSGGKSLINANKALSTYLKKIEELHKEFSNIAGILPQALVEPVEKMLNKDIRYRPNSQLFSLLKFFDDMVLLSIDGIVNFEDKSLDEKLLFLQSLPDIISEYPKELLNTRVFPFLLKHIMESRDFYEACFESLMATIQSSTVEKFTDHMKPGIIDVLTRARANSIQECTVILQYVEPLFLKMTSEDIEQELLPILMQSINSDIIEAQTAAMDSIRLFKNHLDEYLLNNAILPKIKAIFNRRKLVKVRCSALNAVSLLLPVVTKTTVIEDIIPFICEINTNDIDIIMNIIQVYKEMANKRLRIPKEAVILIIQSLLGHANNSAMKRHHIRALVDILHLLVERLDLEQTDSFESNSEQKSENIELSSIEFCENNQDVFEGEDDMESEIERVQENLSPRFRERHCSLRSGFSVGSTSMRKISAPILKVGKNLSITTKPIEKSLKSTTFTLDSSKEVEIDYKNTGLSHRRRQTIDASIGFKYGNQNSSSNNSSYRLSSGKNIKIVPRNIVLSTLAQSQISDEERTMLKQQMTPPPMGRRHSFAFSSFPDSGADLITASVCEGPFQHPASSKSDNRRWQQLQRDSNIPRQNSTPSEKSPVTRQSSFTVLSDAVISFFCPNSPQKPNI